jgi:hypothetical protein
VALAGAADLSPLPGLTLRLDGAGHLAGTEGAPTITWRSGKVDLAYSIDDHLRLETPEARAELRAARASVMRDALGTTETTNGGDVQLACAAADRAADTAAPPNATPADPNELRPPAFPAPAHLPAGETRTCPPTTAAGLLGRARALQRAGADPLPAVDAGLAAGPDAAVRDELVSLLLDIQLQQGDLPGALRTAEAHLKTGGAQRRDALLTLAARLAARLHGCEAATPWLAELGPASGALAAELGCTRIE